jgi:hypothetical protein
MIGSKDIAADESSFQSRTQRRREKKVVDAPADIPGADASHRAPPSVMSAAFLEFAESIDESGFHERVEASAFFGCEAVIAHVRLGIGEVELGVRHIEITAEDDRLLAIELLEATQEIAVPLLAVSKPGELAFRVRDINIDEREVRVFGHEDASFTIVLRATNATRDLDRTGFTEYGGAGVTLLLRDIPVRGITRRPKLFDIVRSGFCFLETEDVGFFFGKVIEEVFAQHGPQSIDVPRDYFHGERFRGRSNQSAMLHWLHFQGKRI